MKKTLYAALVLATALATAASAQTFESAAASALNDSGITAQCKAASAQITADSLEMGQVLMQRGGPRGGGWGRGGEHGHPGGGWGRGPERGGDHGRFPGGDRGHDGDHRGPDRGGWHDGPHGYPHGDWGRWHGHPGWGYEHRWVWREGRPIWWGWAPFVVVIGATHYSCVSYYDGLQGQCSESCLVDNNACLNNCAVYAPGDYNCTAQCSTNYNFCASQCSADRDVWIGRCPL